MIGPQAWENLFSYHTEGAETVIVKGGGKIYTYNFINAWEMFETRTELMEWCESDVRDYGGEYADTIEDVGN